MADGAAVHPDVPAPASASEEKQTAAVRLLPTCPFDRHQLVLDVGLHLGDARELVQRARDVLGAAVAGHGHREESLVQGPSV